MNSDLKRAHTLESIHDCVLKEALKILINNSVLITNKIYARSFVFYHNVTELIYDKNKSSFMSLRVQKNTYNFI